MVGASLVHRCRREVRGGLRRLDPGRVSAFDLPGALRRIRRIADVSQRELASACGLSQSAVAQAESGRRDLSVSALVSAANVAGLRLALLSASGAPVPGMADDAVRDLGGRRFPAHLDTRRSDAGQGLYEPRRDRPETAFTFGRDRAGRDSWRRAVGTPSDHHPVLPGDAPWERAAARRRDYRRRQAEERQRRFEAGEMRPLQPFDCTCPPACDELDDRSGRPVHAKGCPCDCDVA
jgi:transcriptional regulator with XRE-family HTH domain